ncbi:MAG: hypothetical protein DHS20C12_23350 [Pseudohongiella sp.]|nr:MAG: hypothetical protein DHS20C12_23350 [Pseudohongiella sp.]
MPIYEYQCKKCEHTVEALQKIADKPLLVCPSCGKKSLSKLVSAASFRLKGGGWYETDFKTGNKKQLAESESASPSGGKTDSSSAAESGKSSSEKGAAKKASEDSKKTSSKASSS